MEQENVVHILNFAAIRNKLRVGHIVEAVGGKVQWFQRAGELENLPHGRSMPSIQVLPEEEAIDSQSGAGLPNIGGRF